VRGRRWCRISNNRPNCKLLSKGGDVGFDNENGWFTEKLDE
jgi:hypothetical protein